MHIAHDAVVSPGAALSSWSWEPAVLVGLAMFAVAYACGVMRLRRSAPGTASLPGWRQVSFAAGLGVVAIALMSPLHALSEALFSAHMLQHVLLVMMAPALLLLGRPLLVIVSAAPLELRRGAIRTIRSAVRPMTSSPVLPWVVLAAHAVVLWVWHAPPFYEAALASPALHALEHAMFFGSALAFWSLLLNATRRSPLMPFPAVLYVFLAGLQSAALGALLTFAETSLYSHYARGTSVWERDIVADQQLGGLVMWIPGGALYLVVALWLLAAGLLSLERRLPQRDRGSGGEV